ncbi:hypothetical protein ACFL6S_32415 [Candidatus Poribacteria bacterium]
MKELSDEEKARLKEKIEQERSERIDRILEKDGPSTGGDEPVSKEERLQAFVIEQLKAGADKTTICQRLMEMSMDEDDARQLVESIYAQIEEAQFAGGSILPALLGGILAAVVGGAIWGLILIYRRLTFSD